MSLNQSFPYYSALADNLAIFKLLDRPVRATNNPEVSRTCAFARRRRDYRATFTSTPGINPTSLV